MVGNWSLASVVGTLALIYMLGAGVSAGAAKPAGGGCRDAGIVAADEASRQRASLALVCLVNRARLARGLGLVRPSRPLGVAALRHSSEMVARKYFGHDGVGGDRIADRAREAGYPSSRAVSEALAWGMAPSPAFLAKTLLASGPHRRIVLARGLRDVGVGLALGAPVEGIPGPSATLALAFGG